MINVNGKQGPEPGTSARRGRSLPAKKSLTQVTARVYLAYGYSLSNLIFVVTEESVVVIDTGESIAAARASFAEFRKLCDLPVSHIIYTHHHGDHVRGAEVFRSASTRIIAHRRLPEERAKVTMLLPYRSRIDGLQFGLGLPQNERGVSHGKFGKSGYVPPDITFDAQHSFEEGGLRFELYHAAGESVDHLMIWLPEERVLFPGDLFYDGFPMLSNPMKPERPVLAWAQSLDRMRTLRPDHLVPSHGLPVSGADEIETTLSNYAGAIRYVHDYTVSLLNRGLNLEQIKKRVRMPAQWRDLPYLQPRYGTVEWAVCGIFRQYTGWYDLNPTQLNPVPRSVLSTALIDVCGGVGPLLKKAREARDNGEDDLALELADIVLKSRPRHRAALALTIRALNRLGQLSTNRVAQNIYRSAAKSARQQMTNRGASREVSPPPRPKLSGRYQPPVFILAAPRSFTSIVCAMLGQHPEMYALPELHLFQTETMAEWFELCRREPFPRAHGMFRAVAQLFFGEQSEETVGLARGWLKARLHFTTGQLLKTLAVKTYPSILVEKSPSVNYDQNVLARAYRVFPRARFVHLVRHPKGQCESVMNYMKLRSAQGPIPSSHWLTYLAWYGESGNRGEPDPQKGWYALNQRICESLHSVPESQQRMVRGEDVLTAPKETLLPILDWLGIRQDDEAIERMKHPEQSPYACIGPKGAEYGNDRLFLEKPALRLEPLTSRSLEGPVSWRTNGAVLVPEVIELARQFGYQ